jgi:hypothetical protein
VPLNDGDKGKDGSLCVKPVQLDDGQWIPACMDMIEVDDVARVIDRYMRNLAYEPKK